MGGVSPCPAPSPGEGWAEHPGGRAASAAGARAVRASSPDGQRPGAAAPARSPGAARRQVLPSSPARPGPAPRGCSPARRAPLRPPQELRKRRSLPPGRAGMPAVAAAFPRGRGAALPFPSRLLHLPGRPSRPPARPGGLRASFPGEPPQRTGGTGTGRVGGTRGAAATPAGCRAFATSCTNHRRPPPSPPPHHHHHRVHYLCAPSGTSVWGAPAVRSRAGVPARGQASYLSVPAGPGASVPVPGAAPSAQGGAGGVSRETGLLGAPNCPGFGEPGCAAAHLRSGSAWAGRGTRRSN